MQVMMMMMVMMTLRQLFVLLCSVHQQFLAMCETEWTEGRLQRGHASWTTAFWSLSTSPAVKVASTSAQQLTALAQAPQLLTSIFEVPYLFISYESRTEVHIKLKAMTHTSNE